jgi:hypothetical protein
VSETSRLKPGASYVYETPDRGQSIYAREQGTNERFLIGRQSTFNDEDEDRLWKDIRQTARLHSNLQDELDRVVTLYYLLKENTTGDVQWHPV